MAGEFFSAVDRDIATGGAVAEEVPSAGRPIEPAGTGTAPMARTFPGRAATPGGGGPSAFGDQGFALGVAVGGLVALAGVALGAAIRGMRR
jgi:hypothetical protein